MFGRSTRARMSRQTSGRSDTPSWFYFLPNGLGDSAHPEWGGWGGRFTSAGRGLYRGAVDTVAGVTDARATVWRGRAAYQADFQARLDWCVKPFREAKVFEKAYLIQLFQEMVERGELLTAVETPGGYMEIDTQQDFDLARRFWR